MVEVSIFCLIYKSPKYADFMYDQVINFTPMVRDGRAEFYFVANDPTEDVMEHLASHEYPYYWWTNPRYTNEELFANGIGCPAYMGDVYRAYNFGIKKARGEIVVMLCSDQCLSPDWLENLLKYLAPGTCITSMSIENAKNQPMEGQYVGYYGSHPDNLDRQGYLAEIERLKTTGLKRGGAFMPLAIRRRDAFKVGLFPEGNTAGRTFDDIPLLAGDEQFIRNLEDVGVQRYTSLDSIIYHIKEGERDEA